jgi:hypothetical protein
MDELSISMFGDERASPLAVHLHSAFRKALALDSRLPDPLLEMQGMSGRKYRRLINNLVGAVPQARYLEVGSWAGSTACAALYANRAKITCIDNWSEFGGPKDQFLENVRVCSNAATDFTFVESDFRTVDYGALGKHNIYLFDGPHEYQDQYDGVGIALPALEDEFVFIVDDWNFPAVPAGTHDAIRAAGLQSIFSIEVRTTQDGNHAQHAFQASDWHNGYLLSVLRKR